MAENSGEDDFTNVLRLSASDIADFSEHAYAEFVNEKDFNKALEALAVLRAERDELESKLRYYKFPEGDPVEVHPSDSRAESQAGSNGPSGSPTSPSGRDIAARIIRELDTYGDPAIYKLAEAHLALLAEVAASSEEGDDA